MLPPLEFIGYHVRIYRLLHLYLILKKHFNSRANKYNFLFVPIDFWLNQHESMNGKGIRKFVLNEFLYQTPPTKLYDAIYLSDLHQVTFVDHGNTNGVPIDRNSAPTIKV